MNCPKCNVTFRDQETACCYCGEQLRGSCPPSAAAPVRAISLCWLPYQKQPFVIGVIDDHRSPTGEVNVWLLNDGSWTQEDGHARSGLALGGWNPPENDIGQAIRTGAPADCK